jgi:Transposase
MAMSPPAGKRKRRCASSTSTLIPTSPFNGWTSSDTTSETPTIRSRRVPLGRTLLRWKHEIAAWHWAQMTNGPTEAVNNLIKRVKRAAFGFTSFRNYRIRSLLYAGKPDWSLLTTITPR